MTIPAQIQQEQAPYGTLPVIVCFGTQGGPYTVASAGAGFPVAIVAGTAAIGTVSLAVTSAAGGESVYRNLSLLATGISVKGSAGRFYGGFVTNTAASFRYLKIYNKATAPTVGSDTPLLTIGLPPGATGNLQDLYGWTFSLGLGIAATQLVADADTTAPNANDVIVDIKYV